ncbi:MAG: hypothetical protein ISS71_04285 [Phycisphaerae bacterium]|nr:hypothetical protein [Phycisphaerae bacterium]
MSFKLAIGPIKLLLAFSAVLTTCLLGFLMDQCSQSVVVCSQNVPGYGLHTGQTELDLYIQNPLRTAPFIEEFQEQASGQGVFSTLWNFATSRFHDATTQLLNLGNANIFGNVQYVLSNVWQCFRAVVWAFQFHPFYSMFYFTLSFFVFGFFGGAICRCAALEFAQEERPGLFEAFHYAAEKYSSFLSAPLIPLGMVALFSLVVLLSGAVSAIPWVGDLLLSLLFGFLLFFGLLIVLLAIGVAAGGLLLYPSIAYEGTSGLDSIGRSFSYILNRPVRMFYYVFMSSAFGTFFYLILRLMIYIVLRFTYRLLEMGMAMAHCGDKIERVWVRPDFLNILSKASGAANWSESVASFVIYMFLLILIGFLLAYIISYIFSAATVIYALMRKKVDHVAYEQVYLHLEQVQKQAQTGTAHASN